MGCRFHHFLFLLLLPVFCQLANAQRNHTLEQADGNTITVEGYENAMYGYNLFRNKSSFEKAGTEVRFFLRGRKEAKKAIVTGSFTNWSTTALVMTKTDSGWIAETNLPAGRYLYKFIIDGNWEPDSDNMHSEVANHGYINSVYYKPNVVFSLPNFSTAKKVRLAGSFTGWQTQLEMVKTAGRWVLPMYLSEGTYLYQFVIDGKVYADPNNHNQVPDENRQPGSYLLVGKPDKLYQSLLSWKQSSLLAVPDRKLLAGIYTTMGDRFMELADYPLAQNCFRKALDTYQQTKNDDSAGTLYLKLEAICRYTGDFPAARKNIQNAIAVFERSGNDAGLALAYKTMGYHYTNLGRWSEAEIYHEKALFLYQRFKNKMQEAIELSNLAHSNLLIPNDAKCLDYIQRALKLSEEINYQSGIAGSLSLLGKYYERKNALSKAISYYTRALEIEEKINGKGGMAEVLGAFAEIYQKAPDSVLKTMHIVPAEKYTHAIAHIKRSLQLYTDLKNVGRQQVFTLFLSETFERMGLYDSAFYYYKRWVEGQNAYYSTEKERELARLEIRFENRRKEDSLHLEKQLADETLQKQFLLARQQQQQLSLKESELVLSKKEKDLQHLAYLKMQADLQNEQLEKQRKEEQLSSAKKEKQLQAVKVKALIQEQAISRLNRQRQWIYTIGGFAILAFASMFFINRSRLRSLRLQNQLAKEKAEKEQKESAFQQQLADISLTALRSQMNPHFIFNCLNSIKLYTVQNDTAAASEYLTKFSKLIRLVLENSRSERITLASELKALELYIDMEAMRFKEKLRYTITVEENVETDYIEIPPLLLQPYVENSIWHGLMHKEEGGNIEITVALLEEESLLEVSITDDGVGRAKAAEIKSKTATKHRSYGMKATSDRIALINQLYKASAGVTIRDLVDAGGRPAGTQVLIQIPI